MVYDEYETDSEGSVILTLITLAMILVLCMTAIYLQLYLMSCTGHDPCRFWVLP